MGLTLLASLDKNSYSDFDVNRPFYTDSFERHGELRLEDEWTHKEIAYVRIVLYNLREIKRNKDIDMEIAVDSYSQDCFEAMMALMKSKIYKSPLKEGLAGTPLFDGYLDKLYVFPEYRRRGIGGYLLENLSAISEYMFNMPLHGVSACCVPQTPGEILEYPSLWHDVHDRDEYQYNSQFLQKHHYESIEWDGGEYFGFNYAAPLIDDK